jgi:hypothetical protein
MEIIILGINLMKKIILPFAVAALVTGCTASTQLDAKQDNVSISVNDKAPFTIEPEVEHTYNTTSFGQYRFKAEAEGHEPMYGLMPLKFNGGYLAADILFFAPALFFNLREVFPFYELDIENKVIKYKLKESDEWTIYKPKQAEVEGAINYFGDTLTTQ